MTRGSNLQNYQVTDLIALKIQELHRAGKLGGTYPLLKIDNRDQAKRAPFQFDAVNGKLHRNSCRFIPKRSSSALYGIWRLGRDELRFACLRCNPVSKEDNSEDRSYASDLLYGVLSIINQFAGVLRERGLEYRSSSEGRHLSTQLEDLYRSLGDRDKQVVEVVLSFLDGLAKRIHEVDSGLTNGSSHGESSGNENIRKDY